MGQQTHLVREGAGARLSRTSLSYLRSSLVIDDTAMGHQYAFPSGSHHCEESSLLQHSGAVVSTEERGKLQLAELGGLEDGHLWPVGAQ